MYCSFPYVISLRSRSKFQGDFDLEKSHRGALKLTGIIVNKVQFGSVVCEFVLVGIKTRMGSYRFRFSPARMHFLQVCSRSRVGGRGFHK